MTQKSEGVKEARNSLIQHLFEEICRGKEYSDFYSHVYCVIAKVGLQLKAREEGLFEAGDWTNSEYKQELIERAHQFLVKHIR